MDAYYNNQISLPYYSGAARQRGSGIGALAATIVPMALPLFRNVLFPAAKKFARNLAVEALPEVSDVLEGKKSFKKAAKRSLSRATVKSIQRGSGGRKRKRTQSRKRSTTRKKSKGVKRSRLDILSNLK